MNKAAPTILLWGSFGTTNMAVKKLKHLSFGTRAPQKTGASFCLIVRNLSFIIAECKHKFTRIERSTNAW